MTALIIVGIIILLFAFLLHSKIRAEIKFYDGVLDFKVKYLFLTIFPFKKKEKVKKEKKPKKAKKNKAPKSAENEIVTPENDSVTEEKDEKSEGIDDGGKNKKKKDKDKPKKSLSEKIEGIENIIEKVKAIWDSSHKGLKKLFMHIYFDDIVIDFRIAGEDAYKTAVTYGRINAAVYNVIAVLLTFFKTKIRSVDIVCDFVGKKSVYDGEVKITIRPSTIFSALFMIIFGLIRNYKVLLGKKPNVKNQPDAKKAVTV